MLFLKYKITHKYIIITLYHIKYGILYNISFFKNKFNALNLFSIFFEFLFDTGLIKFKK